MSSLKLYANNPVPSRARLIRTGDVRNPIDQASVTVYLAENPSSTIRWKIRLYAELDQNFAFLLGEFVTFAPRSPALSSRIVAMGTAPGAKGWVTEAVRYEEPEAGQENQTAHLRLTANPEPFCCGTPLHIIPGQGEVVGRRYGYLANLLAPGGPTAVTVPGPTPNDCRVVQWAAWQSGDAGMNVRFPDATHAAIPIAPNGTVRGDPQGRVPQGTFVFNNVPAAPGAGAYFIEYEY
jgi:hypothetical protein